MDSLFVAQILHPPTHPSSILNGKCSKQEELNPALLSVFLIVSHHLTFGPKLVQGRL